MNHAQQHSLGLCHCFAPRSPHKLSPRGSTSKFAYVIPKREQTSNTGILGGTHCVPQTQGSWVACPSLCWTHCNTEKQGVSIWGEGGGTVSSLTLSSPVPITKAAFVGCTSGRSRLGSGGHAREPSSPLAAHFDVPDDIKPDAFRAAVLTYSADLASSDASVMCQGAHAEASQARKRWTKNRSASNKSGGAEDC